VSGGIRLGLSFLGLLLFAVLARVLVEIAGYRKAARRVASTNRTTGARSVPTPVPRLTLALVGVLVLALTVVAFVLAIGR
jgi:hypothetical protein